jgi:phenylacetate 2-hydroxylase
VTETSALLRDLLRTSESGTVAVDPYIYFKRFSLNMSIGLDYGVRVDNVDDELLREIVEVESRIAK